MVGPHPFHMVGEKYAHAVSRAAGALPLFVPVLPEPLEIAELLAHLDGLLLSSRTTTTRVRASRGPCTILSVMRRHCR